MIRDYFGHRTQLAAITNIWFNEWRDFLLMKPRKASAVNRITATLMAMRSDAIEYSKVLELPLLPKSLTAHTAPAHRALPSFTVVPVHVQLPVAAEHGWWPLLTGR